MNFIIEVLPKKENEKILVWIVRAQNGFPIAVCDSLEDASQVIKVRVNEALEKDSPARS